MEFERSAWLWFGVLGCVVAVLLGAIHTCRRAVWLRRFVPSGSPRGKGASRPFLLTCAGLVCLSLALPGPIWGTAPRLVYVDGEDVLFVIDNSLSMHAQDVLPSRLRAAGFSALNLMRVLTTARFGLVSFAGDADPLSPMTFDAAHIQRLVERLAPERAKLFGSNQAGLTRTLAGLLAKTDESRRLSVVVFSDGEFFDAPDAPSLERLRRTRARFFFVGMGTAAGATVPDGGGEGAAPIREGGGELVVSRLAEDKLQSLAAQTGGQYIPFRSVGETTDQLLRSGFQERAATRYSVQPAPVSRTRELAWLALSCLAAALALSDRRLKFLSRRLALLPLLLVGFACSSTPAKKNREAIARVRQGQPLVAVPLFREAQRDLTPASPGYPHLSANLADALQRGGKPREALLVALSALRAAAQPDLRETLLYNLGCSQLVEKRATLAAESFRLALEAAPDLADASWNLELALRSNPPNPPPSPPPPPPPPDSGGGSPPPPSGGRDNRDDASERMLDSIKGRESPPPPDRTPSPSSLPTGPYW